MRTLSLSFFLLAMICFFSFQSCSKSSDPGPTPTPVLPDTLTTGWSKVVIPGGGDFGDICFINSTTGYVGGNNLFKSIDGGNTWANVFPGFHTTNMNFAPDGKAFFVSASSLITRTLDGGATFTNSSIPDIAHDVVFVDNNNGYCVAPGGLYNSTDGGAVWTKITTTGFVGSGDYSSLAFLNNTTGWLCNSNGIFRSMGSASTWQPSTFNGMVYGADCVFPVSASNIYAADKYGNIFKSTDGGAIFNLKATLGGGFYCDLHFLDDQNGYACTGRHIYKTTNGGVSWTTVVSLGVEGIIELHFTDATHGWACATGGVVLILR